MRTDTSDASRTARCTCGSWIRLSDRSCCDRCTSELCRTSSRVEERRESRQSRSTTLSPLGHRSGRITTHYAQAELESLITAAEKVCALPSRKTPALVLLRKKTPGG